MSTNTKIVIDKINSLNQDFFELCNHVFKLSDLNNLTNISDTVNEFEKYIEKHIKLEEPFIKEINMPNIKSHLIQHRFFVQKMHEIKHELEYKNNSVLNNLETFLKKWHISHINTSEKYYNKILSEQFTNNRNSEPSTNT